MPEVFYGNSTQRAQANNLAAALEAGGVPGILLIGYPILDDGNGSGRVDALLNSPEHGVVLFLFRTNHDALPEEIVDDQDAAMYAAQAFLGRCQPLRSGKRLGVPVNAITVFPIAPPAAFHCSAAIDDADRISQLINNFEEMEARFQRALTAALQTVTTIKPAKKRANVTSEESRGGIIKKIESEIANLDRWQQAAAIECPDGVQRIRGLAGSGKTIVLALKAAYMHATNADWNIAVVFYSRALYQQFKDLIRRFYFEQKNDEPDWDRIHVMHAWGSSGSPGLYSEAASAAGFPSRTFMYARATYGQDYAFAGVCDELLGLMQEGRLVTPRYDAILIDEAQDLPASFFRIAYAICKEPKRIVFAYDELQTLSEAAMPSLGELFGYDKANSPLVTLHNPDRGPREDVVLEVCYRNTPWALTMAHALGLGIYRNGGLVQHFEDPALWADVGYEVDQGALEFGARVSLSRKPSATPAFFVELISRDDAVVFNEFDSQKDQAAWVASEIHRNLTVDELEPDDILVIFSEPLTAQSRASQLARVLAGYRIASHIVGVTASRDQIFVPGSVAMAHIHRSKGNEAPMVYVLNSEDSLLETRRISRRNMLFTAITRSRAWVRICGVGAQMPQLMSEMRSVVDHAYHLDFAIPTQEELEKLNRLGHELSPVNEGKVKKSIQSIRELVELVRSGELYIEQLPEDVRLMLRTMEGLNEP